MRMTKILATLGPSCNDVEMMKRLIEAGMDGARVNFSHGSHDTHRITVNNLITARTELGRHIPLILDTKGPEIRTGKMKDDAVVTLKAGDKITLTTDEVLGTAERISVSYKQLMDDITVGAKIMVDDGLIELEAKHITGSDVVCVIINGGEIGSNKGINLPSVSVKLPALTEKDINDLKFGVEMGFDYIAASFIQNADDVREIRRVLRQMGGKHIRIISKIENRAGLNNLDEILAESDGIMVARGDLGIEIPPEEVPMAQKDMILKANRMGKLVITATQMLESMTKYPRPTRAEANDVANAVFDGTDAVMLSGETAKGLYPVESIEMMAKIAVKAETDEVHYIKRFRKDSHYDFHVQEFDPLGITNALSYATCMTAEELGVKCIVTVTNSGFTAKNISKFRPTCPILAITNEGYVCRQLNMVWGCAPDMYKSEWQSVGNTAEAVFEIAGESARNSGLAVEGDPVIIVAGVPVGIAGTTNLMKVQLLGVDSSRKIDL